MNIKLTKPFKLKNTINYFVFLAVISFIVFLTNLVTDTYKQFQPLEAQTVRFSKCTDGDTAHFIINGTDETVRFLAIDTPETVKPNTPVQPYGKEASDRTCELITNAKEIKLEYEETNKTDKYGRKLAWVFVDGILLQDDLVSKGLAKVAYLYDDYKYTSRIEASQSRSKDAAIGIWSK
ncbi:thermonuclease family protein [Anaerorhabdus sp.]|uniref:thermonuclease family protein n=1 Tax=Anaerorhabdus sp. TaxID=1872524 RepID=UPI002FCB4156